MLQYDGHNNDDLEQLEAELEDVDIFRGMLPGARILFDVEHCPDEVDEDTPGKSFVITDTSDQKWFVWRILIVFPESKTRIFYRYDIDEEYPEISLMNVQFMTFREYGALFKLINSLRRGPYVAPGRAPDLGYDLAASMVYDGKKSEKDALRMFGEDDREAARQALRRRLKGPVRIR